MENRYPIAQVVLFKRVEQPLDYAIPDSLIGQVKVGMRVVASVRNQQATGIVVGLAENPEVSHIKPILAVLDEEPIMDQALFEFTRWFAQYYCSGWGAAVREILPPGLDASPRFLYRLTDQGRQVLAPSQRVAKAQQALLKVLGPSSPGRQSGLTVKALSQRVKSAHLLSTLRTMMRKNWVERFAVLPPSRAHSEVAVVHPKHDSKQQSLPLPSKVQDHLTSAVEETLTARQSKIFCLPGVSWKTAVPFIAASAEKVLKRQKGVLILVPDVAQVQSMAVCLANALERPVGILHGELLAGVRQTTWRSIASGDISIVVGTRSAAFAPFPAPGLIVLTQEADPLYKAEGSPSYHARDVVLMRGRIHRIPVLLTAVVPSVETYARSLSGECHVFSDRSPSGFAAQGFLQRTDDPSDFMTSVIDLKTLKPGEILSQVLVESIGKRLHMKQPVFLLLNRKGYATALACQECGFIFRCSRCHVAQVYHRRTQSLLCHYCGAARSLPTICSDCRGVRLGGIGAGIEQAEEVLHRTFPGARVFRVDRETHPSGTRKADIWVGTEWFLRWPMRPRVNLIGILDADAYLHVPDFSAAERTFQLIAQVLAEAQSASLLRSPAEVIIQTRYPHHASISWVTEGNPDFFYKAELAEREELGYPPFVRLAAVMVKSADEEKASGMARYLGQQMREVASDHHQVQVLGPAPAPMTLLRGQHRFMLLIKASNDALLQEVVRRALEARRFSRTSGVHIGIDINPYGIR